MGIWEYVINFVYLLFSGLKIGQKKQVRRYFFSQELKFSVIEIQLWMKKFFEEEYTVMEKTVS